MRWLKYFLICVMTLVVFAGGSVFMYVVQDSANLLDFKPKTQYDFTINVTRNIPITMYKGTIRFDITKQDLSKQEQQALESTLNNIIKRASEAGFCTDDKLGILAIAPQAKESKEQNPAIFPVAANIATRGTLATNTEPSTKAVGSLQCSITKNDLEAYNTMLKDIDYLVLKSGAMETRVYSLHPDVDLEERDKQLQALYDDTFKTAQDSAQHYAQTLQKRCALTKVVVVDRFGDRFGDIDLFGLSLVEEPFFKTTQVSLPLKKETRVQMSADITIECR